MKILPLNCGIYMIKNVVTGDFYVGQSAHLRQRKASHFSDFRKQKHGNPHMQNAYNKYGPDKFIFSTFLLCEPFELTYYEQALVDKLNPQYNIRRECVNSPLGTKRTLEDRKKLSESHSGEKAYWLGKHHSLESRAKMSATRKGVPTHLHTQEEKDKIAKANTGVVFTQDRRDKIAKARTGHKASPEAIRHFIESNIGKHSIIPSEETRKKMSISAKNRRARERKERELKSCQMSLLLEE